MLIYYVFKETTCLDVLSYRFMINFSSLEIPERMSIFLWMKVFVHKTENSDDALFLKDLFLDY